MGQDVRADAETILAFLEDVNDEEGRIIVDEDILARMVRVVHALGGVSHKAERDRARQATRAQRQRHMLDSIGQTSV